MVGIVLAVTVGVVALRNRGDAKTPRGLTPAQRRAQSEAKAWQPKVEAAFKATVSSLSGFVADTEHWSTGSVSDEDFRARVVSDLAAFVQTRDAMAAVPAFTVDRRANQLYLQSAILYEQSARTELAAVDVAAGDLRVQLRLSGQRQRELADRVFDRGGALVKEAVHETADPNVVLNLPEEVPLWAVEGLAPGPPLDDAVPGPVGLPPQHAATRPQQPRQRWIAAVKRLAIPSASTVSSVISDGSTTELRDLARRLAAAADALRITADPSGDREGATVVRLGLLVDAESARLAQASRLVPAGIDRSQLELGAQRLALVSDRLWAADLPPRRSGFPASVLHAAA